MPERVSIDDLLVASDWCENGYEGDDAISASIRRVGAWLKAEALKRRNEAAIRQLMQQTDATRKQANAALQKVMEARGNENDTL